MYNRLRKAVIGDICVKDLIFYNEANTDTLYNFCFRNSISYLPAPDRKTVYEVSDHGFRNITLDFDLCLHPDQLLFADSTVSKFAKVDENEIKFVVKDGQILGVVHIVDYNNEFVAVELYRGFFRLENNLRALLVKKGFSNDDFIRWVGQNRDCEASDTFSKKTYWTNMFASLCPSDPFSFARKEENRRSAAPFQTFYFSDLLEFSLDQQIISDEIFDIYALKALRNFVAHNRHFVSVTESGEGQLLYNFKQLKQFNEHMNAFFAAESSLEKLLKSNSNKTFVI